MSHYRYHFYGIIKNRKHAGEAKKWLTGKQKQMSKKKII